MLGHGVEHLTHELFVHGADNVHVVVHGTLQWYRREVYAPEELARGRIPGVLLLGASAVGAGLAPRMAARLRTGQSTDCVGRGIDDKGLLRGLSLPLAVA